jgi:CBS domain-containing protein
MNKSFKYLLLKKDLNQARRFFIKYNVNILPVLNKEFKLIDVITLQDIF